MKVLGGIKGIANNVLALEQYFLLIPEIGGIVEEFNSLFNIERSECKRDTHYQLSGKKNQRLIDNVKKLTQVFEGHKTNFDDSDAVYNTITNKHLADQFLVQKEEGKKRLQEFVTTRLIGDKSIWEPLTKRKLPTLASNNKVVKAKIQNQIINIKAERKLTTRFVIASRSRQEIDLPKYLGEYEFSVVPRSLFSTDGKLLPTNDKSIIVKEIEQLIDKDQNPAVVGTEQPKNVSV